MFSRIRNKLQYIILNNFLKENLLLNYDAISINMLNPLLKDLDYLPYTSSSLRFSHIAMIINDIIINNRKSVIEFGCGISTILIAKIIKQKGLDCFIYSIEDNEVWYNQIYNLLEKENLLSVIKLIKAELSQDINISDKEHIKWYNEKIIKNAIPEKVRFDTVIIDGPPSYKYILARYNAIPFVFDRLSDNYIIFLDDADRIGEKKLLGIFEKKFGLNFKIINYKLGVCIKGNYFNSMLS
jgi:hypothetical protein